MWANVSECGFANDCFVALLTSDSMTSDSTPPA